MLTGIAVEEMLHLALVANMMSAIGAAPNLTRPNFPRPSEYLPGGVQFALLPFGDAALTHFLYLERPEGMERVDAAGFVPAAPPSDPVTADEIMPRRQEFATVGHLYRGIMDGLPAWRRGSASGRCSPARGGPRPPPSCSAGRSSSR